MWSRRKRDAHVTPVAQNPELIEERELTRQERGKLAMSVSLHSQAQANLESIMADALAVLDKARQR